MDIGQKQLAERIYELCATAKKHYRQKELSALLGDVPASEIDGALRALIARGDLAFSGKGRIVKPEVLGLTAARIQATASGYAFITTGGPKESDALLTADDTGFALHGDTVLARITQGRDGRFAGVVREVLAHANGRIVGVLRVRDGIASVTPSDRRIHASFRVPARDDMGAKDGEMVVAEVTRWSEFGDHEARVVQVLGDPEDHNARLRAIIYENGLIEDFSPQALEAAQRAPHAVSQQEISGRLDLREQRCVTIDGDSAKDFDDAVFAQPIPAGYRLYVHIADVSHYVGERSALEHDAFERGTSAYLLDTVLPMLPTELSNGICSLNPMQDRLAFSCIMDIERGSGQVLDFRLEKTAIRSSGRLIYEDVTAVLEGDERARRDLASHVPMLKLLGEVADTLARRRMERGSIDFDLPEADIRLDELGKPISVQAAQRGAANQLIEECMLLANEMVAQYALNLELPFHYRVHEEPDAEKIKAFALLAEGVGYKLSIGKQGVRPKQMAELLRQLKGKPEATMLQTLMLRSLRRARYDTRALGHYGLALKDYCHFTSPIRRYPDLFIHRVLSKHLAGELTQQEMERLAQVAVDAASNASRRERAAAEAEMAVDDWKKAQYMQAHIGERFEGRIGGVSSFGLFVDLPNTVSGLVPIRTLQDDHYLYDEIKYTLTGRKTKKVYRLGDPIAVYCADADVDQGKVEFSLTQQDGQP